MSRESRLLELENRMEVVATRLTTLHQLFAPLIANFPRGGKVVDDLAAPLNKELRDISLEWKAHHGDLY